MPLPFIYIHMVFLSPIVLAYFFFIFIRDPHSVPFFPIPLPSFLCLPPCHARKYVNSTACTIFAQPAGMLGTHTTKAYIFNFTHNLRCFFPRLSHAFARPVQINYIFALAAVVRVNSVQKHKSGSSSSWTSFVLFNFNGRWINEWPLIWQSDHDVACEYGTK